jgi:hypothetical protein
VVVVEVHAFGATGIGYSYCHPSAPQLSETELASLIAGADPLIPERSWAQMQVQARCGI